MAFDPACYSLKYYFDLPHTSLSSLLWLLWPLLSLPACPPPESPSVLLFPGLPPQPQSPLNADSSVVVCDFSTGVSLHCSPLSLT